MIFKPHNTLWRRVVFTPVDIENVYLKADIVVSNYFCLSEIALLTITHIDKHY